VPRRAASVSAGLATRPVTGGHPTPYAARVLAVVDRIPRGKVMSYGDVAEFVGSGSGRAVGAVMSRHGHEVAWQRVVRSSGEPNPASPAEAARLLRAEGVPMRGQRVDMERARWDGRGTARWDGRGTARWDGRGTASWDGKGT
jgi:alkylated DNA nucleotide flippase Atl1